MDVFYSSLHIAIKGALVVGVFLVWIIRLVAKEK
jgi:hypothetical protein